MSSDLLDINTNIDGQEIFLEMNSFNVAFLTIMDKDDNMIVYNLNPDAEGLNNAQLIIDGLKSWIKQVEFIKNNY